MNGRTQLGNRLGRWWRSAVATAMLGAGLAMAACGTPGKDGVGSSLSGVINTYYAGTGTASGTSFTLGSINPQGSQTALSAGDLILIVQMQDGSGTDFTTNTQGGTYGKPSLGSTAGQYEYATVQSVSGNTVTLTASLINTYVEDSATGRSFQVVRVPQYSSATVSGTLKAAPWSNAAGANAPSGGIVAMDVAGQTTLNANIDVSGQGFRGGAGINGAGNRASGLFSDQRYPSQSPVNGASKGEGTAGSPRYMFDGTTTPFNNSFGLYPNGTFGQGAPGNAGGGGNDGKPDGGNNQYNSGGGGGANAGAGGQGGYNWNGGTPTVDAGGRGGRASSPSTTKLFMGGGGGAGTSNNNGNANAVDANGVPTNGPITTSGASGGGMVLVRTGTLTGGGQINANGKSGTTVVGGSEASGAGGAGGSVLLNVNSGSPSVTITAQGGNGGDSNYYNHGPGGGGGGGYIATSSTVTGTRNVSGGAHGLDANKEVYGSVDGSAGVSITFTGQAAPGTSPSAVCLPVLTVTKSTSTPTRVKGVDTTATYTITVSNTGGGVVGVGLTDPLPSPFAYNGAVVTPTYANGASGPSTVVGSGTTTVTFGTAGGNATNSFTIPQGGSVSLTFTVNLGSAAAGTYQNPASVNFLDPTRTASGTTKSPGGTYAGGGTVGGSNYDPASSTAEDVTVTLAKPTITLSKLVRNIGSSLSSTTGTFGTSATGKPGEYLEYCIAYANTGSGSATGLTINDTVSASGPAQLDGYGSGLGVLYANGATLTAGATAAPTGTAQSSTGTLTATQLTYNVGTLAAGGKGVICFKAQVP